jgi:Mor family transcriptional regulator
MSKVKRQESSEVLLDLMIQVANMLVEKGINKVTAVVIAKDIADFMSRQWAKQQVYFPTGACLEYAKRAVSIYEEHDGTRDSVINLARKHAVSERQIYEIIRVFRQQLKGTKGKHNLTKQKGQIVKTV